MNLLCYVFYIFDYYLIYTKFSLFKDFSKIIVLDKTTDIDSIVIKIIILIEIVIYGKEKIKNTIN